MTAAVTCGSRVGLRHVETGTIAHFWLAFGPGLMRRGDTAAIMLTDEQLMQRLGMAESRLSARLKKAWRPWLAEAEQWLEVWQAVAAPTGVREPWMTHYRSDLIQEWERNRRQMARLGATDKELALLYWFDRASCFRAHLARSKWLALGEISANVRSVSEPFRLVLRLDDTDNAHPKTLWSRLSGARVQLHVLDGGELGTDGRWWALSETGGAVQLFLRIVPGGVEGEVGVRRQGQSRFFFLNRADSAESDAVARRVLVASKERPR